MIVLIRILIFGILLFDKGSEGYNNHDYTILEPAVFVSSQDNSSCTSDWVCSFSSPLIEETYDSEDLVREESPRVVPSTEKAQCIFTHLIVSEIFHEDFFIFATDNSPPCS